MASRVTPNRTGKRYCNSCGGWRPEEHFVSTSTACERCRTRVREHTEKRSARRAAGEEPKRRAYAERPERDLRQWHWRDAWTALGLPIGEEW